MERYFGTYMSFETVSKRDSAILQGPDTIVSNEVEFQFEMIEGVRRAWVYNRFDKRIGYLNEKDSEILNYYLTRGWEVHAHISLIAFTAIPDPGRYWGELVVFCYDPIYKDAFDAFRNGILQKIAEGIRLDVSVGKDGEANIIGNNGDWVPSHRMPNPAKAKETVVIKSKISSKEKMIEEARAKNKGCYVLSWVFIIAVIGAIALGLHSCGIF